LCIALCLSVSLHANGQTDQNKHKVACIGFYNLENLFDTVDDSTIADEEFLPTGKKLYTEEVYRDKLNNLSTVIAQLATEDSPDGVAILGVAEVENRKVLEDLADQPSIKKRNYKVVHFNSPDARGIDVGLLYNPSYFKVIESAPLHVPLKDADGTPRPTRDVLWVYGLFRGEPFHIFVNHWPSRRGGEELSAPGRARAAGVARAKIDSVMKVQPQAKIIVMGDLNDDPVNVSVTEVLQASDEKEKLRDGQLYNPWTDYYRKGIGTLAYNDAWNLFDQVIVSKSLLNSTTNGYFFSKAVIFNKPFLFQKSGRYKGYPMRTYDFDVYMRGYSDHLPVYVVMMKKIQEQKK
jgi:endonuclease/exonuclease/phosphatase family metal-dependent hydrolase